ncbi:hypothetical protein CEXT_326041 [Caerostris extrusa]|uniref:Uncharacterized protein n=1 Tax=Caerostris extrusa TaxID=172846 RepID=A0AAV4X2S6_CAEEX|nr:hypothetical protein CEXT_326041 [Caerostris extrusa]
MIIDCQGFPVQSALNGKNGQPAPNAFCRITKVYTGYIKPPVNDVTLRSTAWLFFPAEAPVSPLCKYAARPGFSSRDAPPRPGCKGWALLSTLRLRPAATGWLLTMYHSERALLHLSSPPFAFFSFLS